MLAAEAQLLSCRQQRSFPLSTWRLHTQVNLMVLGWEDSPSSTLCLSEQASRPLQEGSRGQETKQVESGTLRLSLVLKGIVSSFSPLLEEF